MAIIKINSKITDNIEDDSFISKYLREIIDIQVDSYDIDVSGHSEYVIGRLKTIVNKLMFYYTAAKVNVDIRLVNTGPTSDVSTTPTIEINLSKTPELFVVAEERFEEGVEEERFEEGVEEERFEEVVEEERFEEVVEEVFPVETITLIDNTRTNKRKKR